MKKINWNKTYNAKVYEERIKISNIKKDSEMCTFRIAHDDLFEDYENNIYYLGKVGRNTFMYMDNNEWKGRIIYNINDAVSIEKLLMEDNEYTYKEAHVIASALQLMATENFNI